MLAKETPILYFIARQVGAVGRILQQKQYSMKLIIERTCGGFAVVGVTLL